MCAKGSHKVDGWSYQIPGCDESVHTFMTLSDAERPNGNTSSGYSGET